MAKFQPCHPEKIEEFNSSKTTSLSFPYPYPIKINTKLHIDVLSIFSTPKLKLSPYG